VKTILVDVSAMTMRKTANPSSLAQDFPRPTPIADQP